MAQRDEPILPSLQQKVRIGVWLETLPVGRYSITAALYGDEFTSSMGSKRQDSHKSASDLAIFQSINDQ